MQASTHHSASALIPFQFEAHAVRTLAINGEPWFVARDVASVLGYSNINDAIGRHCKGVVKRDLPTSSGIQSFSVIPERDVYRLIMRSKLPAAERFEEWVVGEVLPAIRKTGAYSVSQPEPPQAPILDIFATGRWIADVNEAGWPQLTRIPDDAVFAFPGDAEAMARLIDDVPISVLPELLKAAAARLAGEAPQLSAMKRKAVPTIERLVNYVRNAERYAGDRKYSAALRAGVMPYSKALKLMKVEAETFRALVSEAVETGALTVRRAPELGYPGEVLAIQ